MNVRCPSCQTVYRVDPGKVPAGGVRARCAACGSAIAVAPGAESAPAAPAAPTPAAVAPAAQPPVAAPATPAPATAPTPTPTPTPQATPTPAPVEARAARLSQPFFRPSRGPDEAPAPPQRPSAPVFRPTPGQPVTAPPQLPADEDTAVIAAQTAPPAAPAAPAPVESPAATPEPAPAPTGAPAEPKRPINPFLQRDPKQKARRLARALVSDMIVYQPDKRQQALAAGTLKDEFEDEIQKSWEEYVEQVGEEMATSTDFWKEALNDILAGGQPVF